MSVDVVGWHRMAAYDDGKPHVILNILDKKSSKVWTGRIPGEGNTKLIHFLGTIFLHLSWAHAQDALQDTPRRR